MDSRSSLPPIERRNADDDGGRLRKGTFAYAVTWGTRRKKIQPRDVSIFGNLTN